MNFPNTVIFRVGNRLQFRGVLSFFDCSRSKYSSFGFDWIFSGLGLKGRFWSDSLLWRSSTSLTVAPERTMGRDRQRISGRILAWLACRPGQTLRGRRASFGIGRQSRATVNDVDIVRETAVWLVFSFGMASFGRVVKELGREMWF